jgi:hypothetical protein
MADPLEELERVRRRDQERRERRRRLRRWLEAIPEGWRERQRRAKDRRAQEGHRVSVWQSGRVALVVMVGGPCAIVVGQIWGWSAGLAGGAVLAALLLAHRLEAWWWRRRLPFRLTGFNRIRGEPGGRTEDDFAYVACKLRVELVDPGAGAEALAGALEILASRLSDAQARERRFQMAPHRVWRVRGDTLQGELDGSLWGSRWLEQWLRREAVLLHRAHPIREVVVSARYTGDSYRVPDSDPW